MSTFPDCVEAELLNYSFELFLIKILSNFGVGLGKFPSKPLTFQSLVLI